MIYLKARKLIFSFLLMTAVSAFINPIKFIVIDQDEKKLILQSRFDSGTSLKAAADGYGITDYLSIYFRPAFHIQDFGIGLDFDFRFRFFNNQFEFITANWTLPEDTYNRGVNIFLLYLDKIDYIVYGSKYGPIFATVGRNQITTFGTGLLLKDFHNYSFEPVEKEQGFYLKFNANYLDKYKLPKLPLEATFLINDILDPDIFALDGNFDIFHFTPFRDVYHLKVGTSLATDINATESNRISGLKKDLSGFTGNDEGLTDNEKMSNHRNFTRSPYNYATSFPLFWSLYEMFKWPHNYFQLNVFNENVLLFDGNSNFGFGGSFNIGSEIKVINLKNSGFLLGITAGFILESPHFFIDYFSSNYEILRVKQYTRLTDNASFTPFIMAGFGIYALDEKIKFNVMLKMPIQEVFASRFSIKFTLEDTVIKGLSISAFYETGVNLMYIQSQGGGIIDSLTRDFRFYAEASLKFYSARFSFQIGIQRPAWCIPHVPGLIDDQINAYEYLANGGTIPYDHIEDTGFFIDPDDGKEYNKYLYNWEMNMDQYKNDLQKFIRLEIAFVI